MLGNSHFYNRTIRKIVVGFGTIFNDIYLVRYTKDGLTAKETIKVPLNWGAKEKSFFIAGRNSVGKVDYVPNKVWETDFHYVAYSAAGSDVNSLIVGLGQRLGVGMMSKETSRESDPLIADPELEHDRIIAEGVEAALLSSIQQQAANPMGPYQPDDLAYLTFLVMENDESLYEAVRLTDERAREVL